MLRIYEDNICVICERKYSWKVHQCDYADEDGVFEVKIQACHSKCVPRMRQIQNELLREFFTNEIRRVQSVYDLNNPSSKQ